MWGVREQWNVVQHVDYISVVGKMEKLQVSVTQGAALSKRFGYYIRISHNLRISVVLILVGLPAKFYQ